MLIKVKSKNAFGFRRAGKKFEKDFCEPFEADAKTVKLLKDDPALVVEEVAADKKEDKDKGKGK